jgi:NCS1 family nucleobase:cation symporter-1
MVLNGTMGARLHVSFPVLNRSSFGFWLSYFSVISRAILAMFWFGVQAYILLSVYCLKALIAN